MNNIRDHENLGGKTVLLRLDLNVPFKNGVISDDTRINKIIPVLDFLIKKKSRIELLKVLLLAFSLFLILLNLKFHFLREFFHWLYSRFESRKHFGSYMLTFTFSQEI